MKTKNKNIKMFFSLTAAEKTFDKETSADLLQATNGCYYVDKSKNAIKHWPKLYTLIKTK